MPTTKKDINLEMAWEAVQDMYTTYANIDAYVFGLPSFCSFAEKTYLIKISRKKICAYYDGHEAENAGEKGLEDFIDRRWRNTFTKKAYRALSAAKLYIRERYLAGASLEKKKLFKHIVRGTKINAELFTVFAACQPQYTSMVHEYIKGLLPETLTSEEANAIIQTLSTSAQKTPLREEEIAWSTLIGRYRGIGKQKIQSLKKNILLELEKHAKQYGLMVAADGLQPWSRTDLYKKLFEDIEHAVPLVTEKDWLAQKKIIEAKKSEVIKRYSVSPRVVRLCSAVAELGHIRLCLRIEGWMPIAYILMHELFPELVRHVPYTLRQLESTTPDELIKIMRGDYALTKKELNERYNLVFFGILNGRKVLWFGKEAKKKITEYVSRAATHLLEFRGQTAMGGVVRGRCFVFRWGDDSFAKDVATMPKNAVLVAGQTRPQLMVAIKKASAIITDEGGLLSHAAIVSRELGKPCIIGTKIATKVLKTGDLVLVDADKGIVKIIK